MTTQPFVSTERAGGAAATLEETYENVETRDLVALVNDAAELIRTRGEAAFNDLRTDGSRWRRGESYIFVLDPEGNMLVHSDPALEGRNQLDLKDINGKPIIRGLIAAATALPGKPEGWYHYEWAVPGGLLPRWKSSYVRLVQAPSGMNYIVGSGLYNDRMERAFVADAVTSAVAEIERRGEAAFKLLRDPTGPFIVKDTYVFVTDMDGVELVNPAFPNLEGRKLLDLKDTHGKYLNREMIQLVQTRGSGWSDYMWPKPGESVSTQKSAYVSRAMMGDAVREAEPARKLTAPQVMALVREGAAILEEKGEKAYPDFRQKGSKWFGDDTYFFIFTPDGTRAFHAAEPESEGQNSRESRDIRGRPYGRMILEAASGPSGEGWVHYMYPRPGEIFPSWKSAFVKRVTYPSGKQYILGCGVYNMQMDKAFIYDVVNHAAALIEQHGREAFGRLRDRTGPFVFMDTYVFVDSLDGMELVNAGQPTLEGRNLSDLRDLRGKAVVTEQIDIALRDGSAWLECFWYKPGGNAPARKLTYVRKVEAGEETFVIGSGLYME
jgi:signal transduction histidine kinase